MEKPHNAATYFNAFLHAFCKARNEAQIEAGQEAHARTRLRKPPRRYAVMHKGPNRKERHLMLQVDPMVLTLSRFHKNTPYRKPKEAR